MQQALAPSLDDKIERLRSSMLGMPPAPDPDTRHFFAKGLYVRTIFTPAGTLIVGKRHKTEHFYCVLSGAIEVSINGLMEVLDADRDGPQIISCPVGTRRLVRVLRDSWRMNVFRNPKDIRDVARLERHLLEHREDDYYQAGNKLRPEIAAKFATKELQQ